MFFQAAAQVARLTNINDDITITYEVHTLPLGNEVQIGQRNRWKKAKVDGEPEVGAVLGR